MEDMATPAQVAEALHTTQASLAQMRYRGDGPVFARVGRRRVLYRWCDVKRWIEESLHTRTDQVLTPEARAGSPAVRAGSPAVRAGEKAGSNGEDCP